MRVETTIRVLKAFNTCPKCGKQMMMDEFKADNNDFEFKCKCGWILRGKEN